MASFQISLGEPVQCMLAQTVLNVAAAGDDGGDGGDHDGGDVDAVDDGGNGGNGGGSGATWNLVRYVKLR